MTFLIILFFVVVASPVFFCAGLEKFARAPVSPAPAPAKESGIFVTPPDPLDAETDLFCLPVVQDTAAAAEGGRAA
jgi:hypothetical protein